MENLFLCLLWLINAGGNRNIAEARNCPHFTVSPTYLMSVLPPVD